ncbi:MAG: hypothetical protein ABT940_08030 [Alphaproteobacteria bacterium]
MNLRHSLQTRLFRGQLITALLFLAGALIFCWRMIVLDQTIERHMGISASLRLLHLVIESADFVSLGTNDPARTKRLRVRVDDITGSVSQLDGLALELAALADRALRVGDVDSVRLRERRAEAVRRHEELEMAARLAEEAYRRQMLWVGVSWSMILVLPLVLVAWPLRLSREVIAGIRRLGLKVELGRQTGDCRAVLLDRKDEIGLLGEAIDGMFRTLKEREHEITHAGRLHQEQQKLGDIVNIVGGIAHEIANPLSIVVANLESENERCDTCAFNLDEASPIREGLYRIRALLRDITAVSSGEADVDMVDVNAVIRGILRIICLDDRLRSSRFEAELDPALPAISFSTALLTLVVFSMVSDTAATLHGTQGSLGVVTMTAGDVLSVEVTARRQSTAEPERHGATLEGPVGSSILMSMSRMLEAQGGALTAQWLDQRTRLTRLSLPLNGQEGDRCLPV